MTQTTNISPADLYQQIVSAFAADPSIEAAMLADFEGTVAKRFGVSLPKPGKLVRVGDGFHLNYDGRDYDLGDPRKAAPGELNDVELELVSGGSGDGCPSDYNTGGSGHGKPTQPVLSETGG